MRTTNSGGNNFLESNAGMNVITFNALSPDENADAELGSALRRIAEEMAFKKALPLTGALSAEAANHLVHELHVHQIELEVQNEELRWTQEELQKSRTRYFDLYELSPVANIAISENGLIEVVNLAAAKLLAVPRGTLIKQPLTRFIVREDQDIYYLHNKKLLNSGKLQVCELRLERQGGPSFWAQLVTTRTTDSESRAIIYRMVIIDITEHKKMEIEFQTEREKLEQQLKEQAIEIEALTAQLENEITERKQIEKYLKEAALNGERTAAYKN